MGSLARSLSFVSCATACTWLVVASGCGFDGAGQADVPDAPVVLPDASPPPPVDAAVDAPVDVDAALPPRPCEDPALIACFEFEGSAADGAHAQRVEVGGKVTFVPGIVGQAVLLDATSALKMEHGPAWTYASLTVEAWVRPDALPEAGARASSTRTAASACSCTPAARSRAR